MNLFRINPLSVRRIDLSDVMAALSLALDLVEGQPEGHSVRSAILGMRIGRDLGLNDSDLSDLFYALLMKDLGCSSNAAKMCFLFGADDRLTKGNIKTVNWRNMPQQLMFAIKHVAPGQPWLTRMKRLLGIAVAGQRAGKELIQIRCERGAKIARLIGLSEATAIAIHCLDEHFDGGGHPEGLVGDEIPLLARIMGLAQTAEVFHREHGLEAMRDMARNRRKTWFDPQLVDLLLAIKDEDDIWRQIKDNPRQHIAQYEPESRTLIADDEQLDNIALGFAQVIDAKSPWTFRHSTGVSEIAAGIAEVMGYSAHEARDLRRAGLLHDIGKLGVSNTILDKPGKLTPEEIAEMRKHTNYTLRILKRVSGFSDLAELAASHHERLDGKGYHRGIDAPRMSQPMRILCVADMYEALAARRPYREDLTEEQVMSILTKHSPDGICPVVFEALKAWVNKTGFAPERVAA